MNNGSYIVNKLSGVVGTLANLVGGAVVGAGGALAGGITTGLPANLIAKKKGQKMLI